VTALVEVENLRVYYPVSSGLFVDRNVFVRAVDGVSFSVLRGEVLVVVGESGCGKTTLSRAVVGLLKSTEGTIRFNGKAVETLSDEERRTFRRMVQMIFQDPFDSMNPRKTILRTLAQPLEIHNIVPKSEVRNEAARLLDTVGLSPGATFLSRYPHQFSGGQRQRICIARGLAPRPTLVVADEPVSSLDVSIRGQILTLLRQLQKDLALSLIFVTHDLGVARSLADRVMVMYMGQVVEEGSAEGIFTTPRHPYTRALLAASPIPDPIRARRRPPRVLSGDVPSPINPPEGCRFRNRCPIAQQICVRQPPFMNFGADHRCACYFADQAVVMLAAAENSG
jgi:oligopeptide/dipeptide ABC transporter ATP-binding protein